MENNLLAFAGSLTASFSSRAESQKSNGLILEIVMRHAAQRVHLESRECSLPLWDALSQWKDTNNMRTELHLSGYCIRIRIRIRIRFSSLFRFSWLSSAT